MLTQDRNSFKIPYIGFSKKHGGYLLYGERGDFSAIFSIKNPALYLGADPEAYKNYHQILLSMIKILGEGYIIQKQDIFIRKQYSPAKSNGFLEEKYNNHFSGRPYTELQAYITITRKVKRGAFYVYNENELVDFSQQIEKIADLFASSSVQFHRLNDGQIQKLVSRILSMDFNSPNIALDNIRATDTHLEIGEHSVKSISLINTDIVEMPETVSPYFLRQDKGFFDFPADNLTFLNEVPAYETLIYNQLIHTPAQMLTKNKLELKRKRHSGIPDPANLVCVEDIDLLLSDVARDNQLLVNVHFNILISAKKENLGRAVNYVESALFYQGIVPSRNAYNQMELFRTALPGNAVELKKYDWFLTTAEAALCYFFKESQQKNEKSDFLVRFTDRRGIPLAIAPADLNTGRLSNRSKFTLGPSGTGKSFFMNALIEQYCRYNMDVVIVDTGDSYAGLCSYFKGHYITYTEENPVSMNPFQLEQKEFNLEKKDFLKTLVALLWKGADGCLTQVEDAVISNVLSSYYYEYFWLDPGPQHPSRPQKLNFDSFYLYSVERIKEISEKESVSFDLDEYRYVLKKFFTGQEYGTVLNRQSDSSLFTAPLIVFEIDNIKNNKVLFPIIILVIMDVFLQKMRLRSDRRKALVIEEAWKAIASPLMAGYILYLYKTVRKHWGEVVVVTQELADIIGNPIVKDSIIANSDTICLLDQSRYRNNYDEIAKLLSISETEKRKIFTINRLENKEGRSRFKEVYIRRGAVGEVYGVEVSLFQYLTYTTEKPEKNAVAIYLDAFKEYNRALEEFIVDLKRSDLSLTDFVTKVLERKMPVSDR